MHRFNKLFFLKLQEDMPHGPAPLKKGCVRENHTPFMNKELNKPIYDEVRLKKTISLTTRQKKMSVFSNEKKQMRLFEKKMY